MLKKTLMILLASATLATSTFSGVGFKPVVAEASATEKIITISPEDYIPLDDFDDGEYEYTDEDKMVIKAGRDYYLIIGDDFCYRLETIQTDTTYIVKYGDKQVRVSISENRDVTAKFITNEDLTEVEDSIKSSELDESLKKSAIVQIAKNCINRMYVCDHPSSVNVTLSLSEVNGKLTVNKADFKTATKLDMMLKKNQAVTLRIKASSKSDAKSTIKSLQKLIGHANTYGIMFWFENRDNGLIYRASKLVGCKLKKDGDYYTATIPKKASQSYTYCCKAYKKTMDKHYSGTKSEYIEGYTYAFNKGTHLCDCSDLVKVRAISNVILDNHGGKMYESYTSCMTYHKHFWKKLADNKIYEDYNCTSYAKAAQMIGNASDIKSEFGHFHDITGEPGHAWANFPSKNSSGKIVYTSLDNGHFTQSIKNSSYSGKSIRTIFWDSTSEKMMDVLGLMIIKNGDAYFDTDKEIRVEDGKVLGKYSKFLNMN